MAMDTDALSSSRAPKLRGMLNAPNLGLLGKSLTGAMLPPAARQYWENSTNITVSLQEALF
eukprot:4963374-Karenia_brevis.AAC.1